MKFLNERLNEENLRIEVIEQKRKWSFWRE